MIDPEIRDLWTPAGLLLGFQVTLFKWRLERETGKGDDGDIPWLAPSDYVGIAGMLMFVVGSILLPLSGFGSAQLAKSTFGLGTLYFVSQALGLAGHYQLYNRTAKRNHVWFPTQERIVIILTVIATELYWGAVLEM